MDLLEPSFDQANLDHVGDADALFHDVLELRIDPFKPLGIVRKLAANVRRGLG